MEKIIEDLRGKVSDTPECVPPLMAGVRRLEECRALLERLANDEPAPEGHTFQSWARELLA